MLQPQEMLATVGGEPRVLRLPSRSEDVLGGVKWGSFDELFSPAFWAGRAWLAASDSRFASCRLGSTLREEIAACLLGGYGIPAEVGIEAFHRVRQSGLLEVTPDASQILGVLRQPLTVDGRQVRYRFAQQKAAYLSGCLRMAPDEDSLPLDDREFRDLLSTLPGVGLKTASWITRNWRSSDSVAILDVHIVRACTVAGAFPQEVSLPRDYRLLEERFLRFAAAIGVRPSVLDNLMWQVMRKITSYLPRA